jgi:hypothetical protein
MNAQEHVTVSEESQEQDGVPYPTQEVLSGARGAVDSLQASEIRAAKADATVMALAGVHAGITVVLGLGLLMSGVEGSPMGTTTGYFLFEFIPGWPASVGTLMVALGLYKLRMVFGPKGSIRGKSWAFFVGSVLWAAYGATYVVGTAMRGGIWGPQLLYVGLSVLAGVIARYIKEEHVS